MPPAPTSVQLTAHVNESDNTPVPNATVFWDGGQSAPVDIFGRHTFTVLSSQRFGLCASAPQHLTQCLDTNVAFVRDQFFTLTRTAPPPPVFQIPTGSVHRNGRSFADSRPYYLELGGTLFPTQWLYINDLERLKANYAFLAKYRSNPRELLVVSSQNRWAARYVDPQTPQWNEAYVESVLLAYRTYGLRPYVVLFGDPYGTAGQRAEICQRVTNLTRDNNLGDKITAFAVSNEKQISDVAELESCARLLRTVHPIVALTSAEDFDGGPERVYAGNIATFIDIHPERDTRGGTEWFRPSRKPYEYRQFANMPPMCGVGEPRGRASSLTSIDSLPIEEGATVLAADAVMTWMSGCGQYVLHDGSGIYMQRYDYDLGPRYDNLFDSPYTVRLFEVISKLRDFLPQNLADWDGLTHADPGRNGQFLFGTYANQSWDQQFQQCGMRGYSSHYGAHYLGISLGQCGPMELIGRPDATLEVKVFSLTTLSQVDAFTLAPNERRAFPKYASSVLFDAWTR
jgi:hypothetical protein